MHICEIIDRQVVVRMRTSVRLPRPKQLELTWLSGGGSTGYSRWPQAVNLIDSPNGTNSWLMKHQYARTIPVAGSPLLHGLCIYMEFCAKRGYLAAIDIASPRFPARYAYAAFDRVARSSIHSSKATMELNDQTVQYSLAVFG